MKDFNKTVSPGFFHIPARPLHINIEYTKGKLSIRGVRECYGQCVDSLTAPELVISKKWNPAKVRGLFEVWKRWHLNDMRAECEHQTALGWREKAREQVTIYHWKLTSETITLQNKAKNAALDALKTGKSFTPTPEQTFFANLPYGMETHTSELPKNIAKCYEPKKSLYAGCSGHTEIKTLGWLTPEQHPEGLLSAVCPICGYKRGHEWKTEEVPEFVLQWLYDLPEVSDEDEEEN